MERTKTVEEDYFHSVIYLSNAQIAQRNAKLESMALPSVSSLILEICDMLVSTRSLKKKKTPIPNDNKKQ